ncbi:uncharacterized protein LOC126372999 isoform X2 [Pectinophora gossypiella]|nr:uncharacterized protein LOC126372999 isoform X2 [Pectinophora gossypiella]XP_049874894.1 uncharacterized protein LOC126372999 isoform X2 [Pectinophora gossypiella]XP_049874896.1 uncharacterized protein LOC126372999 isoform X2 [Pectinophora gossypiella]XP_049874897.1 uncharacterized protein LOC126372999 isoform X2 [Pectinophora gossypiella]
MGVPHVTSFCCCFGLEMGAKVVAYLHLLISVCLVVVCSVYASKFGELAGTAEDVGDHVYTTFHAVAVGVAVVSTGHVLLAATLLYGVYKRSTSALRAWVWVMCVLWMLALLGVLVNCAMTGFTGSGSDIFLAFLEGLLFFSILAYCILSVNSYYLMLKSCEDMEGPHNTPY